MRAIFPAVCIYVTPCHACVSQQPSHSQTAAPFAGWCGRLPSEQARALALRDVYRELHDGRNLSDEVSAHFHPCVDRCTTYQAIFRCKVICGLSHHLVGVCLTRAQPDLYSIGSGSVRNHSLVYAEPSGTACGTVRISMKPRKIAAC